MFQSYEISEIRKMTFMDSDEEFELIASQEKKQSFSVCPKEMIYKVKIDDGTSVKKFKYVLKAGSELPYEVEVMGRNILMG